MFKTNKNTGCITLNYIDVIYIFTKNTFNISIKNKNHHIDYWFFRGWPTMLFQAVAHSLVFFNKLY